jgi:hypothetical protein
MMSQATCLLKAMMLYTGFPGLSRYITFINYNEDAGSAE